MKKIVFTVALFLPTFLSASSSVLHPGDNFLLDTYSLYSRKSAMQPTEYYKPIYNLSTGLDWSSTPGTEMLTVPVRWQFLSHTEASIFIPMLRQIQDDDSHRFGVGDIGVGLSHDRKFNLGDVVLPVTGATYIKLPTGNSEKGLGEKNVDFGFTTSTRFRFYDSFYVYAHHGYRFTTQKHVLDRVLLTTGIESNVNLPNFVERLGSLVMGLGFNQSFLVDGTDYILESLINLQWLYRANMAVYLNLLTPLIDTRPGLSQTTLNLGVIQYF